MNTDRRGFLRIAGTAYLTAGLPFSAAAMASADEASAKSSISFPQGVASSDPEPDAILLWTRAVPDGTAPYLTPAGPERIELTLQLSENAAFDTVLLEEAVIAEQQNDFTVRAHIDGLQPGRHYFYRFIAAEGGVSRLGRTMTAPSVEANTAVNLAFASCQNYEQGYYGAWATMIKEDMARPADQQVQFVLHLGDFIYERYRNNDSEGQTFARRLPPFPDGASDDKRVWADSLADYRHLYKTHLADPHLQAARARWPFICTWDDHEFSNDGFQHFSTYTDTPKPELQRRRNAHKAWFEYIPARVPAREDLRIYRKLRWGKHVDLLITDLRSYRSEPPLPHGLSEKLGMPADAVELVEIFDGGKAYNDGAPPTTLPFGDGSIINTAQDRDTGTMMGAEQKRWFKHSLTESDATWKVWGNSLPIMPLKLDLSAIPMAGMADGILSEDAWGGFPNEYRELMAWLQQESITGTVSLSGDHHMHGASTLALDHNNPESPAVAADFNVSGISSTPHFSNVVHLAENGSSDFRQLVMSESDSEMNETWNMTLMDGVLASITYDKSGLQGLGRWLGPNSANPGLSYVDTNSNGFALASFDDQRCAVELITIVAPLEDAGEDGSKVLRRASFSLALWGDDEQPKIEGPVFEGKPSFPF